MRVLIYLFSVFAIAGMAGNVQANPVKVSLTNMITISSDFFLDYTEFKSTDLFDSGKKNYDPTGTISHTYKSGPKKIKYELNFRIRKNLKPTFSQCPYIKFTTDCSSKSQGDYESFSCHTAPINTGGVKVVNMKITVNDKYHVKCTIS